MNNSLCPCGSLIAYSQCCALFINTPLLPQTAEQLMRSRFTAFYLNEHTYLLDTHHPSQREAGELEAIEKDQSTTDWIKLIIHRTQLGRKNDLTGTVDFSAYFNQEGDFFELRESSNFIQENSQWFYLDGEPHIQRSELKFKRNDPCWCNSGKKFKHCHAS
jgi:SEC-C motif domain protein